MTTEHYCPHDAKHTQPAGCWARETVPHSLIPHARRVSRNIWRIEYVEGYGPIHWATGDHWPTVLRRTARTAERLADSCRRVADWWESQA